MNRRIGPGRGHKKEPIEGQVKPKKGFAGKAMEWGEGLVRFAKSFVNPRGEGTVLESRGIEDARSEEADVISRETLEIMEMGPLPELREVGEAVFEAERELVARSGDTRNAAAAKKLYTGRALEAARILIQEEGGIDVEAISDLRETLQASPSKAADRHLMVILEKLERDIEFRTLFSTIRAPQEDNPVVEIIRGTLGMGSNEPVTARDAQVAVVSALLGELRQAQGVGSCFATALAIRLLNQQPTMVAMDLIQLIKNGFLVRRFGDPRVEQRVYLNTQINDDVADCDVDYLAEINQTVDPGIQESVVRRFLDFPGVREAVHTIIGRVDIGEMVDVIKENPQEEYCVYDVLEFTAMKKVGVSQRDLELREELNHVSAEINELQRAKGEGEAHRQKQIDGLIVQYTRIGDDLKGKGRKLVEYDRLMDVGVRALCSREDNGLLQAWEYTLAAFEQRLLETGGSDEGIRLRESVWNNSMHIFRKRRLRAAMEGMSAKAIEVYFNEVKALFEKNIVGRFDASRERFYLYERAGATGRGGYVQLESPDKYYDTFRGLMLEARVVTEGLIRLTEDERRILVNAVDVEAELVGINEEVSDIRHVLHAEGGLQRNVMQAYFERTEAVEQLELEFKSQEALLVIMIEHARALLERVGESILLRGHLSPLNIPEHACNFMTNASLKEAIESDLSASDWVTSKLNGEEQLLILGDSNSTTKAGGRLLFGCRIGSGECKLIGVDESGNQARSDYFAKKTEGMLILFPNPADYGG